MADGVQLGSGYDWHNTQRDILHFSPLQAQSLTELDWHQQAIPVRASLLKYATTGVLAICSFTFRKEFSCSLPHINGSPFLVIFLSGPAIVTNSGKNLALNPTRPRKLRTSEGDYGLLPSIMAFTFSSIGPIPCLVKRSPIKTILVIRNVYLSAFWVKFFFKPLQNLDQILVKFRPPCTTRSSAM